MGFLSGVLGAVKDENEVTTYDKDDQNNINTVITTLTNNIGSGRTGLVEAVDAVKRWLEGYDDEVGKKTGRVVEPINDLIKVNGNNNIPKLFETIKGMQNQAYESVVSKNNGKLLTWVKSVAGLPEEIRKSVNALSHLDDKLKLYLESHVILINDAVTKYAVAVDLDYGGLLYVGRDIGLKLEAIRMEASKVAMREQKACIEALEQEFWPNIQGPIINLNRALEDVHEKLMLWKTNAINAINSSLMRVEEIVKKLEGTGDSKEQGEKGAVKHAAKQLQNKADDLRQKAYTAKEQVEQSVKEALKAVNKMNEGLKQDLWKVKDEIKKQMNSYLKNDFAELIQKRLEEMTDDIASQEGEQTALLDVIDTSIGTYATGLKVRFKSAIQTIVTKIMDSGAVDGKIRAFAANVGAGKVAAIKAAMKQHINAMDVEKTPAAGMNSEEALNSIQEYFEAYAKEVDPETKADGIARQVADDAAGKPASPSVTNRDLEQAVSTVLTAVQHAARQVKEELSKFTVDKAASYNLGTKLDEAIGNVKSLGNILKTQLGDTGSIVRGTRQKLSAHFDEKAGGLLNEQIGQDERRVNVMTSKIDLQEKSGFAHYVSHVKQTSEALASLSTPDTTRSANAGHLPKTIADIHTEIVRDAHLGKVKNGGDGKMSNTFDEKTFQNLYATVESNLNSFTKAVQDLIRSDANTTVNAYLVDLKKMLNDSETIVLITGSQATVSGLSHIIDDVDKILYGNEGKIKNNLEAIIKAARAFNGLLGTKVSACVSAITKKVEEQVTQKIASLQKSALSNFATSKAAALQKLKELVTEEKNKIDKIIAKDLESGLKGMMGKMKDNKTTLDKINSLATTPAPPSVSGKNGAEIFRDISTNFTTYYGTVHDYIKEQIKDPAKPLITAPSKQATTPSPTDPAKQLTKIKSDFDNLLNHLHNYNSTRKYIFDNSSTEKLATLKTSVVDLSPSTFANPRHPELLDAVRQGLQGFVKEMERVYVNKYEGHKETINFDELVINGSNNDKKLSDDGRNLSKVFLTILDLMHRDFEKLRTKYSSWYTDAIHLGLVSKTQTSREKIRNPIGLFFSESGYKVASDEDKQDGELQNDKTNMNGRRITDLCYNEITKLDRATKAIVNRYVDITKDGVKLHKLLDFLFTMLDKYRRVCHLHHISGGKPPTTVYQMLLWLTGLYWNNMYGKVNAYIPKWFNDFTAEYKLVGNRLEVAIPESKGFCTIQKVDAKNLQQLLNNVTIRPYQILVALCGHGHSEGRYACDFFTNADKLLYPSRDSDCFDMFIDICMRLNQQLRFLYKQCTNYMEQSGWRDCHYGKGIAGSSWNCNSLQCPNQIGDQMGNQSNNQIANQTCGQTCDQTPKCGMKSPLQSFLEDGLQGFLPHQFTSPGCKLTCSVRDHAGKTCLTPMGFADIGIAASHTKTGDHLRSLLAEFCGPLSKQLTMLCAYVTCLQRRPPQTLGDMFAFYHNFLGNWKGQGTQHKYVAFNEAVRKAYFGVSYAAFDPSNIQVSVKHNDGKHSQGDLFSLLNCDPDKDANLPCGQYLQPLTLSALSLFTDKHANLYLSWIMYMTETFYDLLAQLWNQCCRNCDKPGSRCHDRRCSKKCTVKSIYETTDASTENQKSDQLANIKHQPECNSIVKCQSTHPTIYKYGFTFGSPYKMSGPKNYDQQKRTCKDFCEALKRVLAKDSLLVKLIGSIDDFLWAIRTPFSYLVLALWSASFLYLLYVYIGRLDTLHIRSHLRIPSSHKITAQSLLAASRIGKLAKIAYLQP